MRSSGCLVLLLLHLVGSVAGAEPLPQSVSAAEKPSLASDRELERNRLLAAAQGAHERGQHEIALGLASEALSIRESSALWRFVAEQHWLLGNGGAARQASERCLDRVEREAPSSNRAAVERGCRFIQEKTAPPSQAQAAPEPPRASEPVHDPSARPVTSGAGDGEARTSEVYSRHPSAGTSAGHGHRWLEQRSWAAVAVGVGASALVSAAIARLVANGWYDELKRQCRSSGCPEDARAIQARIKTLDSLGIALTVGGAGLTGLGVTGLLVSVSRDTAGHGAGAQVRGHF